MSTKIVKDKTTGIMRKQGWKCATVNDVVQMGKLAAAKHLVIAEGGDANNTKLVNDALARLTTQPIKEEKKDETVPSEDTL